MLPIMPLMGEPGIEGIDVGKTPVAIGLFIPIGPAVFHAIFLMITFDLSVPKHGQTGEGCHHGADTKIFTILAKLLYRGFLVGVVHEVDIPLENLGVEF